MKSTAEDHSQGHALTYPRKHAIPFEEHRQDSDLFFAGEEQVTTKGVEGGRRDDLSETLDGGERFEAPLNSKVVREPSAQIRSTGTKEVTPKALIEAGPDPSARKRRPKRMDSAHSLPCKTRTLFKRSRDYGCCGYSAEAAQAMVAANIPLTYSGEDPRSLAKPLVAA